MCVCACVCAHVRVFMRACVCLSERVYAHVCCPSHHKTFWSRHKKMTLSVWSSNKTFLVVLYHWHCKICNSLSSICLFVDSPRVWTQLTVLETEKCRHDHRPGDHCQATGTDQTGQQADKHEADMVSDWHRWKTDTKARRQTRQQIDIRGHTDTKARRRPGNRSTSEDRQTQRQGDDQATDRHQRTDTKARRQTRQQIIIRGQTQRQRDRPGNRSTSEDRHKGKETDQATDQHQRTDIHKGKRQTRQQIDIRRQTDRLTGSNRSQAAQSQAGDRLTEQS